MIDSGWNWMPSTGWVRCRTPMMTPESVRAVTSRSGGTLSGTMASEWYRMVWSGSGSPANTPRPSWCTVLILPCTISPAPATLAP